MNRFVLSMVLLFAGLSLGESALMGAIPSKYEKKLQAFAEMDRTNPPPKGGVLFVGSSSIELWKSLSTDFPDLNPIQRGIGGTQISDMIAMAEQIVIPYQPRTIVFYAGDNDIAAGKNPKQVEADFKHFASLVWEAQPKTEIYFLAIKPSPSRWHLWGQMAEANQLIKAWTLTHPKLHYVDVATPMLGENGEPKAELFVGDKLHLNSSGYELWAHVLRKALQGSEKER